MVRALILTSLLLLSAPPVKDPILKAQWKQNGYIGSCAGMGCMGYRSMCSIYSVHGWDGKLNTFYCYLDD